ncbi:MAG: ATP synthase F1 subunit epsilon [Saprospiraceae bacterium]|jgi:F-type H+-transporting ATPase subunit epsilon|nr:ATP synthase F1 subunit epsilon [Saprospiraceae bacterium]
MQVSVISPESELFSGEASSVKVPGTMGGFQILNNHAPIVSSLTEGTIEIKTPQETLQFNINGGFVEVLNNQVSLLVTGADLKV